MTTRYEDYGRTERERLAEVRLEAGDLLLVHGAAPALEALAGEPGFVPLSEVKRPAGSRPRALFAALILVGVYAEVAGLAVQQPARLDLVKDDAAAGSVGTFRICDSEAVSLQHPDAAVFGPGRIPRELVNLAALHNIDPGGVCTAVRIGSGGVIFGADGRGLGTGVRCKKYGERKQKERDVDRAATSVHIVEILL